MKKMTKATIGVLTVIAVCLIAVCLTAFFKSQSPYATLNTPLGKKSFDVNSQQLLDGEYEYSVCYSPSLLRMKNLTSLSLMCENDLGFLKTFEHLESLKLEFYGNANLLNTLPYMPNLRQLTIRSFDEPIALDETFADNVPNLDKLYLNTKMENDFSVLSGLKELTYIYYLYVCDIQEKGAEAVDIRGVQMLPRLETFYVDALYVRSCEGLEDCANLKTLVVPVSTVSDLSNAMNANQVEKLALKHFGDEILEFPDDMPLREYSNLEHLTLRNINIKSTDFVKSMPGLKSLRVHKSCISDENVKSLEDMGIKVYLMEVPI